MMSDVLEAIRTLSKTLEDEYLVGPDRCSVCSAVRGLIRDLDPKTEIGWVAECFLEPSCSGCPKHEIVSRRFWD